MIRKSFGAQRIEHKLADFLKSMPMPEKKQLAILNNLIKNWEKIVGDECARFCRPKSVRLERQNGGGKLTVSVSTSAVGFLIKGNTEMILENIASCYGKKIIEKIIVKLENGERS